MKRDIIYFLISLTLLFISCGNTAEQKEPTHEEICKFSSEEIKWLEEIKEEINFTVYLTGDIPYELKKIEKETKKLLEDLHHHHPKINFNFKDPYEDEHEEHVFQLMENLAKKGVPYSQLERMNNGTREVRYIFPGGIASCRGIEFPVVLFDVPFLTENFDYKTLYKNVTEILDYKFISFLKKIIAPQKPRIAILTGHGEADEHKTFIAEKAMKDFYEAERVSIKSEEGNYNLHALENYDGLIICKPVQPFVDREKFIIDQFIMNGGKTIWMIDPVHVDEKQMTETGETFGMVNDLAISELLFSYGIRINPEIVTEENGAPIAFTDTRINIYNWYFYPLIKPDTNSEANKGLGYVKLNYPGTIDFTGDEKNIKKTVLLRSGEKSKSYKAPVRINSKMALMKDGFKNQFNSEKTIALLVEGPFDSFFKNTFPDDLVRESVYKKKSDVTKILVVADGDLIINEVDSIANSSMGDNYRYLKLSKDKYGLKNPDGSDKYAYSNLEFFMNVLDEMMYE